MIAMSILLVVITMMFFMVIVVGVGVRVMLGGRNGEWDWHGSGEEFGKAEWLALVV
jgi:hypothetical protein